MDKDKIKLLVIEDDVNILAGLCALAGQAGYSAMPDNGSSAIKDIWLRINSERPEYIVLDLLLPGYDGLALLKMIKQDPEISQTPVFVFADMSDADLKKRCLDIGADFYFPKSEFDISGFIGKISGIIRNLQKLKAGSHKF